MYDWLPEVCREIRGNLVTVYWLMIVPLSVFLITLEFFKLPEQSPNVFEIIKRAIISIILLISFEEIIHIIAFLGDGISASVGDFSDIKLVLGKMWSFLESTELSWTKFKETIIWVFSLLSYILAYLGVFIADALIHFCWAILYIVSPLMILAYIPRATSGTCVNLYKSLCTIMCWKIVWAILGALLLKFSMAAPIQEGENYNVILLVVMNFFIGASMLFVPIATKSLIGDGLTGFATGLAAMSAMAVNKIVMRYSKRLVQGGTNSGKRALAGGLKGTGRTFARGAQFASRGGKMALRESSNFVKTLQTHNVEDRTMNGINKQTEVRKD